MAISLWSSDGYIRLNSSGREARIDRAVWNGFGDVSAFGLRAELMRMLRSALNGGIWEDAHRAILGHWYLPRHADASKLEAE